jgi:hypothetical protein
MESTVFEAAWGHRNQPRPEPEGSTSCARLWPAPRALIEEGLRAALARREQKVSPYRWPDLSVTGEGLSPEIEEGTWESLRDRIYAGRGA